MSIYFAHINTAIQLVKSYDGQLPFHLYIKQYFQKNKKFGSKDRRNISMLCFNFYRLAAVSHVDLDENGLLMASYICEDRCPEFIQKLKPDWPQNIENKWHRFSYFFPNTENVKAPWKKYLSENIDATEFINSLFTQPKLFLRLKPGYERRVMDKLDEADIAYTRLGIQSLALANSSKIDGVLEADKEVQIQDLSSQQVAANIVDAIICDDKTKPNIWDCCAASGGKSLHLYDYLPEFHLTVSDIRPSILQNLALRFRTAGLKNYRSVQLDLTVPVSSFANESFDYILADVPCSGSGTWARSPENFQYFDESSLVEYAALQRSIVSHVLPKLKKGGLLFYITCSAFSMENEENISQIFQNQTLTLRHQSYFSGAVHAADTMFLSIFTKT